jgi:hypothetical protein
LDQNRLNTDRSAHAGNEDNATSATRNHNARCFTGGEESTMDIDVEQAFYTIKRIVKRGIVLHNAWGGSNQAIAASH